MDQNWIEWSDETLKQLRKLVEAPDQDRLDLVRVMLYALGALGRSLSGWMQWINSPHIMSTFNRDELEEMAKTLTGMVEKFIEYDRKVTEMGVRKGVAKRRDIEEEARFVI